MNAFTEELIQKALSEDYKNFDCVGTYDQDILFQFFEEHRGAPGKPGMLNRKIVITPKETHMLANYLILLFIDKDSCDFDIEEWRTFNKYRKEFEHIGVKIIGVSTITEVELRKLFKDSDLKVKFPVIMDRSKHPLSQSFGFYYSLKGNIGPRTPNNCQDLLHNQAKAIAILKVVDDIPDLFWMQIRLDSSITKIDYLHKTLTQMSMKIALDSGTLEIVDAYEPRKV